MWVRTDHPARARRQRPGQPSGCRPGGYLRAGREPVAAAERDRNAGPRSPCRIWARICWAIGLSGGVQIIRFDTRNVRHAV